MNWNKDVIAGVTVAIVLVPQAMAYAMLAGLPPEHGLYASVIPVLVYAALGSSPHLSVGPVAIISLMAASACAPWAEQSQEMYINAMLLLTFLTGVISLLMSFLKAGTLFNHVSPSVIRGFTSAAAIVIACTQIPVLLGLNISSSGHVYDILMATLSELGGIEPGAIAISSTSLIIFAYFRHQKSKFPVALPLIAILILIFWLWGLDDGGIDTVGRVPAGLPQLSLSFEDMSLTLRSVFIPSLMISDFFVLPDIWSLIPSAFALLFVGYVESMALAGYMAARGKYRIDSNRELRALGIANTASAFFSGMPVAGSLSRTALNESAGATSRLASVVTAAFVLFSLLVLTPLFVYLPRAVLAAVVIFSVSGLIDLTMFKRLYSVKSSDAWIMALTFMVTLLFGVGQGLVAGIVISLLYRLVNRTPVRSKTPVRSSRPESR